MTDVKRLLAEASPLPWWTQTDGIFGPDGDGIAEVFGNAAHLANAEDNAALIVHAVNHLPDYEALVDAAESCLNEWDRLGPTGTQDTVTEHASLRVAVRRLRDER